VASCVRLDSRRRVIVQSARRNRSRDDCAVRSLHQLRNECAESETLNDEGTKVSSLIVGNVLDNCVVLAQLPYSDSMSILAE